MHIHAKIWSYRQSFHGQNCKESNLKVIDKHPESWEKLEMYEHSIALCSSQRQQKVEVLGSCRDIRFEYQLCWGRWFDLHNQIHELPLLVCVVPEHLRVNLTGSTWPSDVEIDLRRLFNIVVSKRLQFRGYMADKQQQTLVVHCWKIGRTEQPNIGRRC